MLTKFESNLLKEVNMIIDANRVTELSMFDLMKFIHEVRRDLEAMKDDDDIN